MTNSNTIDSFKIESYGDMEIEVRKESGRTTHKYYSVPRDVIRKFINASKAPTLKDFEGWLNDAREKEEKARGSNQICCISGSGFWAD